MKRICPIDGWVLQAIVFVLVWLATGIAANANANAFTITDERGKQVSFALPPLRVVSLLPSLTETVCALGECARLVGVDRYSNWPASIAALPKVGGGIDPNIEAIVKLRPDVVLMARSSTAASRLESLGVKVIALEPKTHADVRRVLGTIGQLFGIPAARGADRVWQEIEAAMTHVAADLPARARAARVYIEVSAGPYAAGESSFIGETLTRLGAQNIVPRALGAFPRLNPEFVVRANPDVIMIGDRTMQPDFSYPGWSGIRAVREKRVCHFSREDGETVVRPGPRMGEAARIMARCLTDKAP